jgi:Spy/CpxP family protein refolding chaperone
MEELHRGLVELEALGLDERAFAAKLETLGALQGRLWESRILMLHRISRVATPVQRERLQELFRARTKDKDRDSRGGK